MSHLQIIYLSLLSHRVFRVLHPLPHGDEADFGIRFAGNESGWYDIDLPLLTARILPAAPVLKGVPRLLGKSFDLLPTHSVHRHGDKEANDSLRALSAAAVLYNIHAVSGAVDADFDILHSLRHFRECSLKQSELVVAGRHVPGTELAVDHHVQLGNVTVERHVRLVFSVFAPDIVASVRGDKGCSATPPRARGRHRSTLCRFALLFRFVRGGAPRCVEEFRRKNPSRLGGKILLFGDGF